MTRFLLAALVGLGIVLSPALPSRASLTTTGAGPSAQGGGGGATHFLLLNSGGKITLEAGGSLLCNAC